MKRSKKKRTMKWSSIFASIAAAVVVVAVD